MSSRGAFWALHVTRAEDARRRNRLLPMLTASALLAGGLGALVVSPAAAAPAPSSPPSQNHSIIAFPDRDFVHGDGWQAGDQLTVEVFRGGTRIGVAGPFAPIDDPTTPTFDGLFDLNHLGEPCWSGVTPDLIGGDVVRVTDQNGVANETPVASVSVTSPATAVGADTIVMHGVAASASGQQLPIGEIQARIVAKQQVFPSTGKRDLRATPVYDDATTTSWTATWTGLSAQDVSMAVTAESRMLWLGRNPGAATSLGSPFESTIAEWAAIGGPAAGCTAPAAHFGVTDATPSHVNAATGDLVLSGISNDATSVSVVLSDLAGHSLAPVVATPTPGTGAQTWSVTIPAVDRASLLDGTLFATGTWTITDPATGLPMTLGGTTLSLLKDTVSPGAPVIGPSAGSYTSAQSVSINGEPGAAVRFTVDGSAPTTTSTPYTGPFSISSNVTVRAIAIDAAGNVGQVASAAYQISLPTVPGTPSLATASAGDQQASATWTVPANGGSAIIGYVLRAVPVGQLTGPSVTFAAGQLSGTVPKLTNGVPYRLDVAAINGLGTGTPSAPSAAVTPTGMPAAPTNVTALAGVSLIAVAWSAPGDTGGLPVTDYRLSAIPLFGGPTILSMAPAGARTGTIVGLAPGTQYWVTVEAVTANGVGAPTFASAPVTTFTTAGAPTIGASTASIARVTVRWLPPGSNGGSPVTGYDVRVVVAATGSIASQVSVSQGATSATVTGLVNGQTYRGQVRAVTAVGPGAWSATSNAVVPATVPGAARIVVPLSGSTADHTVSATARWAAPLATGGAAVTSYRVWIVRVGGSTVTRLVPATARSLIVGGLVRGGSYRFRVQALNRVGSGPASALSAAAIAR